MPESASGEGGCLLWGGGCLLWGACLLWGGFAQEGVSACWGVCLLPGDLLQGVSAPGGHVCSGGVSASGGCGIPACTEADTPLVNKMTKRCKNITLATTSLRPVKICVPYFRQLMGTVYITDTPLCISGRVWVRYI